jgi:hypothetical protein
MLVDDLETFLKNGVFDENKIYYGNTLQIFKYRKKTRNIHNSLSRNIDKCKKFNYIKDFFDYFDVTESRIISGKDNYLFLTNSLKKYGWLEDFPITLYYSEKRKRWCTENGHHRINICVEIGINLIPFKIKGKDK